jgi:hypothetical protein
MNSSACSWLGMLLLEHLGPTVSRLPKRAHIANLAWEADTAIMAQGEIAAPQLPQHKVKYKMAFQRACNEKDVKGKLCGGHLKRWFYLADVLEQACGDVRQAFGDKAEMYRCEHCRTLYLPSPEEPAGRNVAGLGKPSVFGLTLDKKEPQQKPE